jgi:hypothetical protein
MKNYILIGLFSILIIFGIVMTVKCSKLERENIKLKTEQNTIIDSIKIENEILEKDIIHLSNQILICEHKIDSLKKVKQRVIVEHQYIISDNLEDGAKKLKENLK